MFNIQKKMSAFFLVLMSVLAVNCAPHKRNPMINEGKEFFGGDMKGVRSQVTEPRTFLTIL